MHVCRKQHQQGLYYLFEHPRYASSWQEKCVIDMIKKHGGVKTNADLCQYGMQINDLSGAIKPAKKPTTFLTNAPQVAGELSDQCCGNHDHANLYSGNVVRTTQEYPDESCKSILKGLIKQIQTDGRARHVNQVSQVPEESISCSRELHNTELSTVYKEEFYDDMSGEKLDPKGVREAREEEMKEVYKHDLYKKVKIEECRNDAGRDPIGTRWVDINKGDNQNPEYRSRLVAQEIKTDKREDLFAATPPLEAKKLLMILAVIEGIGFEKGSNRSMKLDFIDVRRAYFHAKAKRKLYVKLPPEDYEPGMCGCLNKAMYGTRDAAQNWASEYIDFITSIGFAKGMSTPCVFYHKERNLRVVVHGDDFTILAYQEGVMWFRQEIQTRYEVKLRGCIGSDKNDLKEMTILNRIIEWTDEGIIYEADQRHADIIIRDLGLERSNPVVTPGENKDIKDEQPLSPRDASMYRALVARGLYLSQDRSDICYAVKELSRRMSDPTASDWESLKRLGRYLVDKRRYKVYYHYQDRPNELTVWTDSDYAGCLRTRKRTSGGVVMIGTHWLKGWSTTQNVVALSSGEAEYYSMVKGGSIGLGIRSLLGDLGLSLGIKIKTDASAAQGIANRTGLGKIRHIEVSQLWLQEHVNKGVIRVQKVKGGDNLADAMTKHLGNEGIIRHIEGVSALRDNTRHEMSHRVSNVEVSVIDHHAVRSIVI